MDNHCRDCRHVRTAEELGVVSPVTAADEMFCGKHPPQTGMQETKQTTPTTHGFVTQWVEHGDQPIRLPPCNDGKGYRNMACFEPDDAVFTMLLVEPEAEALAALFEWRADMMRRAAAAGATTGLHAIALGSLVEKVNGALGYMRSRGKWRVKP